MIIFPDIPEIEFWGTYDCGVPGQERIVLKPLTTINLASYGILVGYRSAQIGAVPFRDQFYWSGELVIQPPAWIFIYTGPGTPMLTTEKTTNEPVQALFWGRTKTIFHDPNLTPVLFKFGAVVIPDPKTRGIPYNYQSSLPFKP